MSDSPDFQQWDTKIAWDVKNEARWLPTQEQTFVLRFFLARINILIQRIDKDSLLKQRKADFLKKKSSITKENFCVFAKLGWH